MVFSSKGFPGGLTVKRLPAMQEMQVQSLGWEDPLEKEMATHSSILAWEIPWLVKPDRLQSMGCKESDMTKQLHFHFSSKEQAAFNFNVAVTVRSDFGAKKIKTSLSPFFPNLFAMKGFLVAQLVKSLL